MANSKMICAKCGGEMNHHADKLIYSTDTSPAGMSANTYFGGIVEETHGCPGCGAVESRRAE